MAPVEFEKELRKRLHSREMRPSGDAWERIASRLDEGHEDDRRSPRWWMGVAAASVVFLAAAAFFWERNESQPGTEDLVGTPVQETAIPGLSPETPDTEPNRDPSREVIALGAETEREAPAGGQDAATAALPVAEPVAGSLASREAIREEDTARMEDLARQLEVVANRIAAGEPSDPAVSDAEIDALLKMAQQAIASQEKPEDRDLLDPAALLAQAEEELDQTFREKIMEKVKTGVTRLRTAVAQNHK